MPGHAAPFGVICCILTAAAVPSERWRLAGMGLWKVWMVGMTALGSSGCASEERVGMQHRVRAFLCHYACC